MEQRSNTEREVRPSLHELASPSFIVQLYLDNMIAYTHPDLVEPAPEFE